MFGSLTPKKGAFSLARPYRFPNLFGNFEQEMEELVKQHFGNGDGEAFAGSFVPQIDLVEAEKEYEVKVDLPGLKPEEVSVELKNNELWIQGKREEEKEEKDKTFHRVERRCGEFRRVIPMPAMINEEDINASFTRGVLSITFPKTEEAKTKNILIKD